MTLETRIALFLMGSWLLPYALMGFINTVANHRPVHLADITLCRAQRQESTGLTMLNRTNMSS